MTHDHDEKGAQYQRRDPSKQPTSLEEQQAAVEGTLAADGLLPADNPTLAEHNRRAAARQEPSRKSPMQRATEQMLAIMNEFEEERRAEIIAAGGDPDEDRDPLEYPTSIADQWDATEDDEDGRAQLLDRLALDLSLPDLRALRLAAEAAAAVTPRLVVESYDEGTGVKPAQIAADLGVSESYVYRILRAQRAK
ncbi:helix-turn-helix domain-containing protein [Streptomyces sp. BBFR2]|uniref:helix-turn-helix domain-containing protein n=1 Tax=Streptomyces sp. BBFR2 TaxID=3372854 RepID=UPI0037D99C7D